MTQRPDRRTREERLEDLIERDEISETTRKIARAQLEELRDQSDSSEVSSS